MSTAIMDAQLRAAINADRVIATRGCRGEARQPNGVAVEQGASVKGIWYWRNGAFELFVGGDGPIVAVDTVAEAVRYSRDHLCS
ncbi:MAG: hypothetical protein AB7O57_13205 [Hyphomicrobiaceae bacterium]